MAARLKQIFSAIVPFATGILFVLIGALPIGVSGWSMVSPLLVLGIVFFWAISRPTLLPPVAVFTLGILYDALSGGPLGLWALVFLLVQFFVVSQRRVLVGISFALGWVSFMPVAFGAAFFAWAGASIYYGTLVSVTPVLVQAALTLAAYPLVAWISIYFRRRLSIGG